MFYQNWMSYIKEDTKMTKLAIPGAHNACTKGMAVMACCQNGTPLEQFEYGVRKFGIRVKNVRGVQRIAHGLSNGMTVEEAFSSFRKILDKYGDFMILDLRAYQKQRLGPIEIKFKADNDAINGLIEKYLEPEKYALTDIPDLKALTVGDVLNSGKRYVIHSEKEEYIYSKNIKLLEPWDAKVFGYKPEKFAKECVNYLRNLDSDGFFWFQTQQTPNPGTENGLKWPNKLDVLDRPFFPGIMQEIASDPVLLDKVNIVAGDFMTKDHMKTNEILRLNLLKGVVKPELAQEYANAIGKTI